MMRIPLLFAAPALGQNAVAWTNGDEVELTLEHAGADHDDHFGDEGYLTDDHMSEWPMEYPTDEHPMDEYLEDDHKSEWAEGGYPADEYPDEDYLPGQEEYLDGDYGSEWTEGEEHPEGDEYLGDEFP